MERGLLEQATLMFEIELFLIWHSYRILDTICYLPEFRFLELFVMCFAFPNIQIFFLPFNS